MPAIRLHKAVHPPPPRQSVSSRASTASDGVTASASASAGAVVDDAGRGGDGCGNIGDHDHSGIVLLCIKQDLLPATMV